MNVEKKELTGKQLVDQMDAFQASRWCALFEAVNVIADHARRKNVKFNKIAMKSNAIEEYVNHNSNIIYRKLVGEERRSI